MGGRSMKDVGGAVLAGSSPPFLGRERAAVDVVGPERRSHLMIYLIMYINFAIFFSGENHHHLMQ